MSTHTQFSGELDEPVVNGLVVPVDLGTAILNVEAIRLGKVSKGKDANAAPSPSQGRVASKLGVGWFQLAMDYERLRTLTGPERPTLGW